MVNANGEASITRNLKSDELQKTWFWFLVSLYSTDTPCSSTFTSFSKVAKTSKISSIAYDAIPRTYDWNMSKWNGHNESDSLAVWFLFVANHAVPSECSWRWTHNRESEWTRNHGLYNDNPLTYFLRQLLIVVRLRFRKPRIQLLHDMVIVFPNSTLDWSLPRFYSHFVVVHDILAYLGGRFSFQVTWNFILIAPFDEYGSFLLNIYILLSSYGNQATWLGWALAYWQ